MTQDATREEVLQILQENRKMTLATSVDGNSTSNTVFYIVDGFELYFFTLLPTRKFQQIMYNQRVSAVIDDNKSEGARGIQIQGRAVVLRDPAEIDRLKPLLLKAAVPEFESLFELPVARFVKIVPEQIKLVDFYSSDQFQFIEFPENRLSVASRINQAGKNKLRLWVRALRAPFFTATIIPMLLGIAIAFQETGEWNPFLALVTLFGGVCVHAGTNLSNDYFDHLSGNDELNRWATPFNGGSRIIQAGLFSPLKVLLAALACFGIGSIVAFYLNDVHPDNTILIVLAIALILGFFYTADPLKIGYRGAGEVAVAIGFGPLAVLCAYYVQTGDLSLVPLFASIPVAILIGIVLFVNEFQDEEADAAVGKNTLVVRLGKFKASKVYYGGIAFSYIWILAGVLLGLLKADFISAAHLPVFTVATLITLPLAFKASRILSEHYMEIYDLIPANALTIMLHISFGLLYMLGFLIAGVL
ncbi:MAG: UbiA family prenyltransferase [Candidatus Heimdallarchaeota archaeon]